MSPHLRSPPGGNAWLRTVPAGTCCESTLPAHTRRVPASNSTPQMTLSPNVHCCPLPAQQCRGFPVSSAPQTHFPYVFAPRCCCCCTMCPTWSSCCTSVTAAPTACPSSAGTRASSTRTRASPCPPTPCGLSRWARSSCRRTTHACKQGAWGDLGHNCTDCKQSLGHLCFPPHNREGGSCAS